MRLEIEVSAYDSAAEALLGGNTMVASAYGSLTSKLSGYSAMGGDDTSSEEFVAGYDRSAAEVVAAIGDLATAFGTLATITDSSGANHRDADAGSVYRDGGAGAGAEAGAAAGVAPKEVATYTPPSALGGDAGDMPEFWDVIVDHLQGWAWPSADTGRLREAAGTWRTMAGQLDQAPSYCRTASSQLAGQRSPEISLATTAIGDLSKAATDLAGACRDLADSCEEYAEKVDTTKDVVKGLLRDLAIEIGATAVVSGLASLVTFGGAAVVGGGVAVARAIACARKVIVALQGIRAIRAIAVVARTVDKATDVRVVLRRFQSARNLRHKPTGKLPPKGKPNSYGYDKSGDRLPYANSRPDYGKGQVDEVYRRSMDENGDVFVLDEHGNLVKIEWSPGQSRDGVWDMGHVRGHEYRDLRDDYLSGRITKDEFMQRYRDPDNYEVQHPGRNRSHMDEAPSRGR